MTKVSLVITKSKTKFSPKLWPVLINLFLVPAELRPGERCCMLAAGGNSDEDDPQDRPDKALRAVPTRAWD